MKTRQCCPLPVPRFVGVPLSDGGAGSQPRQRTEDAHPQQQRRVHLLLVSRVVTQTQDPKSKLFFECHKRIRSGSSLTAANDG